MALLRGICNKYLGEPRADRRWIGALRPIAWPHRVHGRRRVRHEAAMAGNGSDKSLRTGAGIAIGIAIGIALDNVAAGIGIGLAIGIAMGLAGRSKR